MARRRKEDSRAGLASRGMVRRWGRFSSRVRHRVVPDRERVPERCHASGAAVDVWVAYLALADNVPRPLSNCPNGMNQSVISPRIRFFGGSCHPVD